MEASTLIVVTHPVHTGAENSLGASPEELRGADHSVYPQGFFIADSLSPQSRLLDRGSTRGDGIFETISVTSGTVHALDAHLERFAASARLLDLPTPDLEVWHAAITAAISAHASVAELSVKLVLTRGPHSTEIPSAWISANTAPDYRAVRIDGVAVVTLDRGYRHDVATTSPWLLQGAKTLSYAVNLAALREAARRGAHDVVFVSSDGYLLEGPTSSLILQSGNRIRTPRADQGILAGTTQASAFEFFESEGFETGFELMPAKELREADAAWLVSSVRQAVPVRSIDGTPASVNSELTARLNAFLLASPR